MFAVYGRGSGVEQQEVSGAVGVLGLALRQTRLPERRGLLVTEDARDGDAGGDAGQREVAVHLGRASDLRQHRDRDAHRLADVPIPVEGPQIHQQRA